MRQHLSFASILLLLCYFLPASAQVSNKTQQDSTLDLVSYRNIGPFRGGRSCAVAGVAGKPNLFYFGATGGGVWQTENGGRSWQNISDGYFGGSIGAIAVAPSDDNVIYVGGGEKTVRGNVSFGYGVWKTEDKGKTWKSCGLDKSRHIGRIKVHPQNADIVFAAVMGDLFKASAERGIYKSIDGGKNWNKVLFVNDRAGFVDLVIDPNNHRILYATSWRVTRSPYDLSSGGEGSALWKSTDGGNTWQNISGNEGLPSGVWGISAIAVSYKTSDKLWALIENENGGVYQSLDAGKTWKKVNDDRSLRQRAWYYTRIYADTKDDEVVYVLNVSYHKSNDGGKTFKSAYAEHSDHHDLWIAPEDPNRMIIADDGGAQVTYDGGETWSTYHNQPTGQFYRLTTDNHFPYRIYAAQQDNSTIRIQHRSLQSGISETDWQETAGGESAHIAVDPLNDEIVYGGSYDGFLTRENHQTKSVRAINVWPDNPMGYGAEGMKYRFQWNFPIFFSKHNPKKLYAGSQHLHVTVDEGQNWDLVSPDLTRNEAEKLVSSGGPITKDNTSVEYYATIFAADESPLKEGLIWVGSDDGRLHITQDGGKSWNDVTDPKIMPKYLMFNSVEPSSFDPAVCYVAGTSYKEGDYSPYLFKTKDYGKTWKKIVSGIPEEHFTRVVREDPSKKGVLYAGTETGMYFSTDDGESWKSLQLNLPIVPITDLKIKEGGLIVATQGRGIWILDDLKVLHQVIDMPKEKAVRLFTPKDVYRMPGSSSPNAAKNGQGTNHAAGLVVHYLLPTYDDKKDTIAITIMGNAGDTIISYSNKSKEKATTLKPKKGANTFNWNMRYPDAKSFDGMILWWSDLSGPLAVPGEYKASLKVNNNTLSTPFKILKSPVSEGDEASMRAQFNFVKSIDDKINEAHQAIIDIRSLQKSIKLYEKELKVDSLKIWSDSIGNMASIIEKELYQTQNKSNQDPLNYPIKLTNKLAHLNALSQMGTQDFGPTTSMVAVRDQLVAAIDKQLSDWRAIHSSLIPMLNDLMRKSKVDYIQIGKN